VTPRQSHPIEFPLPRISPWFSSLFERAGGPRNFMKNRSNGRMGVRRDEVGKRSGEVEAVSLFDPEHARFERIIGRRWLPYGSLTAT